MYAYGTYMLMAFFFFFLQKCQAYIPYLENCAVVAELYKGDKEISNIRYNLHEFYSVPSFSYGHVVSFR